MPIEPAARPAPPVDVAGRERHDGRPTGVPGDAREGARGRPTVAVDLNLRCLQAKREVVTATRATEIAAPGVLVELLGDRAAR